MSCFGLVFESGCVDGDTSLFLLWGLVDFAILDVLAAVHASEVLCDGRCEGCFTMIDMADRADYIK